MRIVHKTLQKRKTDLMRINLQERNVRETKFNLNLFSDEKMLTDFRLTKRDVYKISRIINFFCGRTERRGYFFDKITSECILLRRLAAP